MAVTSELDPWADLVGQDRAVAHLRAAVEQPAHAYLLVGPEGSGKRAAARALAGALLAADDPDGADRHVRLALAEQHPDLRVVEPQGATVRREEAEAMVRHASRSPVEGVRKVVVGVGFEAMEDVAVGLLLKSVEEPPPSTVFVLLTTEVTPELVTVASRCVTIELQPVPTAVVAARLVAEGTEPARAEAVAAATGGDLARARLLTTDERFATRLDALRAIPGRLDGTGARAAEVAAEIAALVDDAQVPLDLRHEAEVTELTERIERYGQRGSGRKELEDRHKREVRRHRAAELRAAFAALAGTYRDALVDAHRPDLVVGAIARLDEAAVALDRYPNETLLLQALVVRLPSLPA